MLHNVKSFLKNYLVYFPIALGVWQILKFTPPAGVIRGVMRWLLWLAFPGFFPAYERLQHFPGCVFKTVKCVVLTKGKSHTKTKRLTNTKKQVTTTYYRSAPMKPEDNISDQTTLNFPELTESTISTGASKPEADSRSVNYLGETSKVERKGKKVTGLNSTDHTEPTMPSSGPGGTETGASKPEADSRSVNYLGETSKVERKGKKLTLLNSTEHTEPTMPSSGPGGTETVASKLEADFRYMGENFEVKKEGNKVSVNGKMSYYISDRQWKKICNMEKKFFENKAGKWSEKENEVVFVKGCKFIWEKICAMKEKCFKKKDGKGSEEENKVVFVKGCKYIWEKVATGKVMEFEEVLDDIIFENNDSALISNDVWFLPVDLSEKSEGKLPKLLNLVGLIPRVSNAPFLVPISLTIAAAVLEFSESLRSLIYENINKMFCRLVQHICNKLPYSARKCLYLLFIWAENLRPRNDIRLKVERRDSLNVFIGGAAKTNSPQEATRVDWLDKKEGEEYEFRCGCSIAMNATYDDVTGKCTATVQHTNAVFGTEERVFVKCETPEEFQRIGTLLSCVAASKAGSLFKYDCNDNKVHVRGWRESLRHYKEAGFPEIYKLTLHDVIV